MEQQDRKTICRRVAFLQMARTDKAKQDIIYG